jgi:hypothetical protein
MARKMSSRIRRAITSSLALMGVAGLLAASNAYIQSKGRDLATGPKSQDQLEFFLNAVERPDSSAFFKRLTPAQKLKVAQNLQRYSHPKLIRLATLWLTDFDVAARAELAKSVKNLAPEYPKAVAEELSATGGFQKISTFTALRASFDATLPYAVDQLSVTAARPNAIEYLVLEGAKTGPAVRTLLQNPDRDTRLAAAEVLGKVGFRDAVPELLRLHRDGDAADKGAYAAALANMGDPRAEQLFVRLLNDPAAPAPDRASAILGLGKIGSESAIRILTEEVVERPIDRGQILEAMSLAGDRALDARLSLGDLLEIARSIRSHRADAVIRNAIRTKSLERKAAEIASGRPGLVPDLTSRLFSLDPASQGSSIEAVIKALASTAQGRAFLQSEKALKNYGGFVQREVVPRD